MKSLSLFLVMLLLFSVAVSAEEATTNDSSSKSATFMSIEKMKDVKGGCGTQCEWHAAPNCRGANCSAESYTTCEIGEVGYCEEYGDPEAELCWGQWCEYPTEGVTSCTQIW